MRSSDCARSNSTVPARGERWLSLAVGVATGLITAATGVFVIPAVPYLQALGLDKDDLVQALGVSFTVSTVALAALLMHAGSLQVASAGASALAHRAGAARHGARAVAARAGASRSLPPVLFRRALLVLGAHLALRPGCERRAGQCDASSPAIPRL